MEECCDGDIKPKLINKDDKAHVYGVVGSIQNCIYVFGPNIDPCPPCSGVGNCGVNCNCYTPPLE